jgi:Flp pilus assembly protein TadG
MIGRSQHHGFINLADDRSGVVAIEFALILPIMLIIFLAAMRPPTSSSPI